MIVDIYARKSQESDERQVLSLDAQVEDALERIKNDPELELGEIFRESKSASIPYNRPEFDRLLERAKKGESRAVICWKMNRLARNPIDEGAIKYYLYDKQYFKKVIQVEGATHLPTDNVMLSSIEFAMATQFSRDLKIDVERGQKKKAKDGGYNHKAPLGYKNDKGERSIFIDEDRAPYIKMMFQMRAQGVSVEEISRRLFMSGLRTRADRRLHPSSITKLLKNPFYMGRTIWRGKLYHGAHEPLISEDLWLEAQGTNKGVPKTTKHKFLYSGIFKCGSCGCAITAEKQKGHVYYRCTKKRGECPQKYVREDKLEDRLLETFKGFNMPKEYADMLKDDAKSLLKGDIATRKLVLKGVDNQISLCEGRLDSLSMKYLDNQIAFSDYQKIERKLKLELKGAKEERERIRGDYDIKLDDFLVWLELMISFDSWVKGMSRLIWSRLLNMIGSNFILEDGKPVIETKTPLFEAIENAQLVGGRAKGWRLELIERILENFGSIRTMLDMTKLNPLSLQYAS